MDDSHTVATIGCEGAPVALCVTRQRVIAGCNRAFAGLFGYRVDELVGHSMALLYRSRQEFHGIGRRGYPRMQQSRRYEDERLMRRRDNELIWCRVSGLTSKEIAADVAQPAHGRDAPHAPAAQAQRPNDRAAAGRAGMSGPAS